MIIFVWLIQLVVMASFDTRKDVANKLLNWSALLTSLVITFLWGNVFWLIVPLAVIPVIAGVTGGTVKGLYLKNKGNKNE